jgi:hypothetical protein
LHGDSAAKKTKTAMAERTDVECLTEFPSMCSSEWSFGERSAG